ESELKRLLDVKFGDEDNVPDGILVPRFIEYTEKHRDFGLSHSIELISMNLLTSRVAIENACSEFGSVVHVKMGTNRVQSMASATVIFEDPATVVAIEKLPGHMILIGNDSGCIVRYGTRQMGEHLRNQ
ncbi:hypothetical protein BGZ82_005409, partial [Podila clonocystis]